MRSDKIAQGCKRWWRQSREAGKVNEWKPCWCHSSGKNIHMFLLDWKYSIKSGICSKLDFKKQAEVSLPNKVNWNCEHIKQQKSWQRDWYHETRGRKFRLYIVSLYLLLQNTIYLAKSFDHRRKHLDCRCFPSTKQSQFDIDSSEQNEMFQYTVCGTLFIILFWKCFMNWNWNVVFTWILFYIAILAYIC